jgi:hypothetical protein
MSMSFIRNFNYNPFATRELFDQATPKVKRGLFGRETRTEGFSTESCEAVAKRIMAGLDRETDKYTEAFADILRVKILTDPKATTKSVETLMYEAFSDAFKSHFEKATYNGEKAKHKDKDLFTRSRAHAKAERLAYELTARLLKDKRAASLSTLFTKVADLVPGTNLAALDIYKDRLVRDIKTAIDAQRATVLTDADTLFEEIATKMRVVAESADKTDSFITQTITRSKWESRLIACSSLQVQFGETLKLGTSKKRNREAIPIEWTDYRSRAIAVADHLCLRAITQRTIDPFFKVAQSCSSTTFDHMDEILSHLERKDTDGALGAYTKLAVDQRLLLDNLLKDLAEATAEMPEIPNYDKDVFALYEQIRTASNDTQKAEISHKLAGLLFLTSLSFVKFVLRTQVQKVRTLMDMAALARSPALSTTSSDPLSPKSAASTPSSVTTSSPVSNPVSNPAATPAAVASPKSMMDELRARMAERQSTDTTESTEA